MQRTFIVIYLEEGLVAALRDAHRFRLCVHRMCVAVFCVRGWYVSIHEYLRRAFSYIQREAQ